MLQNFITIRYFSRLITFYISYMLTLLFFRFSFFEKNQYVYIVRSVNGKDFQLIPAQFSFFPLRSLSLSFLFCRENFPQFPSIFHSVPCW